MALDREQQRVLRKIKRIGAKRGESPKEIKAAIETGLVESNLRNLGGGDADSAGWRQERASLYRNPTNLRASINRFYDETSDVEDDYGQAGALAAAVQRPAAQYRGRYQERAQEAQRLLGQGGTTGGVTGRAARTRTTTTRTPGVSNAAARGQLIANFLEDKDSDPLELALGIRGLADIPGSKTTRRVRVRGQRQRAPGRPRARGAGAGEIHELFWNGPGAQNIDEGKTVGKGFVSGHTDHVHLAADRATMERAEAEAKRLGLNVGEYGRGVSAGHAPNSFHYRPFGAMDVSGDPAKMAKFAKRVARGRI